MLLKDAVKANEDWQQEGKQPGKKDVRECSTEKTDKSLLGEKSVEMPFGVKAHPSSRVPQILEEGKQMTPKNVWISIEDRLPEQEGLYLAYTPSGNVRQALFDKDQCWRPSGSNRVPPQLNLDVSHWMDLPLPPGSPDEQNCISSSSKAQIRNLLTPCLTLATITLEDPLYEGLPKCAQQVKISVDKILEILKESPTGSLDTIKQESLNMICDLCCSLNPQHSHDVKNCRCSQTEFLRGK